MKETMEYGLLLIFFILAILKLSIFCAVCLGRGNDEIAENLSIVIHFNILLFSAK